MSDDDNDPRLLTGAYSLDAVSRAEAEAFEHTAENSETLRDETDGLVDTATLLGLAATPVEPSAGLKQSIFALLDSTPQLPADAPLRARQTADAPEQVVELPVVTDAPMDAVAGPREAHARQRWFSRPAGILTAVAAAAALFVGGGFVGSALVNGSSSTSVIDAAASQLAQLTAADDAQRATVPVEGGGSATVVWSNELNRSAVLADGLPSLPDGKVYEAWYIDAEGAAPAGTFTAAGSGTSWHVLDGAMTPGDVVGVTVEPAGGSQTPTTDPIIVVQSA